MNAQDFMYISIGLACLVVAGFLAFVFVRLAALLTRAEDTLGKADATLEHLDAPIVKTMDGVGNITQRLDTLLGKVNRVTSIAERAADVVDKASDAAQSRITPTVLRIASLVAGLGAGTRDFFTSRDNGSHKGDR